MAMSMYRQRRPQRALIRSLGTPIIARGVARTARTLAQAAKKLAPYARAAGAKSSIQRKLGPVKVKVSGPVTRSATRTILSAPVSTDYDAPGNEYSKEVAKIGYKKRPTVSGLNRLVMKTLSDRQYRFQNLSNQDTSVGALPLAQRFNTIGNQVILPLHVYDLTSFPNVSSYSPGQQFQWSSSNATADIQRVTIPSQISDGSLVSNGVWVETQSSSTGFPDANVMLHKWSDVRLLLYGARSRSTVFTVTFFRCKDETANPFHAAGTNTDLKQLVEWFTRPNMYNSIQTYDTKISKKIKIIKQYKYHIPAGQSIDLETTTGKQKEVRIFMRHDRVYKLDWMSGTEANLPHTEADGLDFTTDFDNQNTPWHSSRVFMAITALCTSRANVTSEFAQANASTEPSYDIIVRNAVTTP